MSATLQEQFICQELYRDLEKFSLEYPYNLRYAYDILENKKYKMRHFKMLYFDLCFFIDFKIPTLVSKIDYIYFLSMCIRGQNNIVDEYHLL